MKKSRLLLSLSLVLAMAAPQFLLQAKAEKSGWIDGDQEEIRLPQKMQQQWRPADDAVPASTSGRGYQAADQDERDSNNAAAMQGSGNNFNGNSEMGDQPNTDEMDSRPISTPKLTLKEGGSHVISGGVTSANFRTGNTLNRGTDARAQRTLDGAAFLPIPRTIAIQPGNFKAFLDKNHAGEVAAFSKTTVIEIKGQWDDCGHALRNFGFPFTRLSAAAIGTANLSRTKIIIVNCGAEFDADGLEKIREFVAHGGFLMTTDWALDSCLQKAFPGYVSWNGAYTDNSVVDAVVVDRDPELISGVPQVGFWKLEDKSQTVQVIRKLEVQVLVRSRVLSQREPSQLGILALTFPYGDGQILHLVGHFDNNADRAFNNALPDPAPAITIALRQAIAANFITAAARDGQPEAPQNAPQGGPDQQ